MSSCSSCLCLFIFKGPAKICDVTMSHTWIYMVGARKRPCFFLTFSLILLVSVVSCRPFRFVVSGFSTCRWEMNSSREWRVGMTRQSDSSIVFRILVPWNEVARPQSLRSFWPAAAIERSGSNHFRTYAIDADYVRPDGQNSLISFVTSRWLLPELSQGS